MKIEQLTIHAEDLRILIEKSVGIDVPHIVEDFPNRACRLTSNLLAYHLFKFFPDSQIEVVAGSACDFLGADVISHAWLEIDGFVVDLTRDQYNSINDSELNPQVIKGRPYPKVVVELVSESICYDLFDVFDRHALDKDFSNVAVDYLWGMEESYEILLSLPLSQDRQLFV